MEGGDPRNPRVSLLKKYDIPVEHLTYEHIEECTNKKELERIVRILRSGEEGTYPDLIKFAEERLRKFAPESRVLRVETPVLTKESLPAEEWKAVENELLSWEEEMVVMDSSLDFEKGRIETVGSKSLPGIRKVTQPTPKPDSKKIKPILREKNEKIKSGDYAAWDKFDVDKELLKIDVEEERRREENEKKKREIKKMVKEKKFEIEVDEDSYSLMEKQVLANQAKDRGNECYKSGDLTNALKYYDISIKLYSTANAYNNRAMTYLKMNQYDNAVSDCSKVLELEKNNIKALHRRATAYQNMTGDKNYDELALQDLTMVVLLEPNNKVAQADLQKLKKKLCIEDVGKRFRMPISESGQDLDKVVNVKQVEVEEKKSSWNIKDTSTSVDKLPLTFYGPSTSTFQCEPYSVTHRVLSGSALTGQVLCKCNSNRPRQNPLCQKCGEKMCTPKPSHKAIMAKPKNEVKTNTAKKDDAKNQLLKQQTNKMEICNNKRAAEKVRSEPMEKIKLEKIDNKSQSLLNGMGDQLSAKGDIGYAPESQENTVHAHAVTEKGDQIQTKEEVNRLNTLNNDNKVIKSGLKDEGESKISHVTGSINNQEEKNRVYNKVDLSKDTLVDNKTDVSKVEEENRLKKEESIVSKTVEKIENTKPEENLTVIESKSSNSETAEPNCNNIKEIINLETSSSQGDVKHSSKKSKNKKKKSKEHKEIKIRKHLEPVKIVHAAKYLHPTSVEPKVKTESFKEPQREVNLSTNCQFKAFVPNRKCLSAESGRMDYLASIARKSLDNTQNNSTKFEEINGDLSHEGNKENILENKSFTNVEDRGTKESNESEVKKESIESAYEFIKTWEGLKKVDESYAKRAEIIRLIKPCDLGKVIGIKLDSDMLSCLLECLEKHFAETEPNIVVEFLKQLPEVPRFGLVKMFLGDNDKKILKKLVETAEGKGFTLEEDVKTALTLTS